MASGKSYGPALEYEILCKSIIYELNKKEEKWEPWVGDGVDERFQELDKMLDAKITFDIAMKNSEGRVIVGECKKIEKSKGRRIEQGEIFEFYGKLMCLRKALNSEAVDGIFATSTKYREGALFVAHHLGIRLAECKPNQLAQTFHVSFLRPNPVKRRRPNRDHKLTLTENIKLRDAVKNQLNPGSGKESTVS